MNGVYLDWASTTPVAEPVLEEYLRISRSNFGNASSQHLFGRLSLDRLEQDRESLAGLFGVASSHLYFTSGGSEANRIILHAIMQNHSRSQGRIIISSIEHPSITDHIRNLSDAGFDVVTVDAPGGFISHKQLTQALSPHTVAVMLMAVNNVTGTIQPIEEFVSLIRSYERSQNRDPIHIHVDMVQSLGKIPLPMGLYAVDSAAFSAHKVMGPKGSGVLYARSGLAPISPSGMHEQSIRPGTLPCPLIAASRIAIEHAVLAIPDHNAIAERLRDHILTRITAHRHITPLIASCGDSSRVHPSYVTLVCGRIPSEVMVRVLNDQGFAVSAGSACSSRDRKKRQRVITAMGFSPSTASSVIRISTGPTTNLDDIDRFCDVLIDESYHLDPLNKGRKPRS